MRATNLLPIEMFLYHAKEKKNVPYLHQPASGQYTALTWSQIENEARIIARAIQDENLPPRSNIALVSKIVPIG